MLSEPFAFPFKVATGPSWGEIDGGDELIKKEMEDEEDRSSGNGGGQPGRSFRLYPG